MYTLSSLSVDIAVRVVKAACDWMVEIASVTGSNQKGSSRTMDAVTAQSLRLYAHRVGCASIPPLGEWGGGFVQTPEASGQVAARVVSGDNHHFEEGQAEVIFCGGHL